MDILGLKSFEVELSIKCIKCGHRSSIAIDPKHPVICDRCDGPVIIEDWCLLAGE
ncbi:zinc finger domain-containing protein [uncultured Methanomethylovorans sp.]|uniref:zinc finger domain-containing protein n=1 Tax=uncultured Methanomethylovorans sp. TaxID=183759 RepID=UPI0037494ADD